VGEFPALKAPRSAPPGGIIGFLSEFIGSTEGGASVCASMLVELLGERSWLPTMTMLSSDPWARRSCSAREISGARAEWRRRH
jgi:hypothetical protein